MFENQFPNEAAPPHSRVVSPSSLLKERGAKWFDYVIKEDGELVVGDRLPGQGHANLAEGGAVRAAGQVQVSGGQINEIDNASGHYLTEGPNAQDAALEAFRYNGFSFSDQVYIEKFWNKTTQLWEAI
jgi:hypothetical protein